MKFVYGILGTIAVLAIVGTVLGLCFGRTVRGAMPRELVVPPRPTCPMPDTKEGDPPSIIVDEHGYTLRCPGMSDGDYSRLGGALKGTRDGFGFEYSWMTYTHWNWGTSCAIVHYVREK